MASITNDYTRAMELLDEDWFKRAYELATTFFQLLGNYGIYVFIHSEWMKHFDDKDKQGIGIEFLLYVAYINQDDLSISLLLDVKNKLQANMNAQLLFEQLAYQQRHLLL